MKIAKQAILLGGLFLFSPAREAHAGLKKKAQDSLQFLKTACGRIFASLNLEEDRNPYEAPSASLARRNILEEVLEQTPPLLLEDRGYTRSFFDERGPNLTESQVGDLLGYLNTPFLNQLSRNEDRLKRAAGRRVSDPRVARAISLERNVNSTLQLLGSYIGSHPTTAKPIFDEVTQYMRRDEKPRINPYFVMAFGLEKDSGAVQKAFEILAEPDFCRRVVENGPYMAALNLQFVLDNTARTFPESLPPWKTIKPLVELLLRREEVGDRLPLGQRHAEYLAAEEGARAAALFFSFQTGEEAKRLWRQYLQMAGRLQDKGKNDPSPR